VPVGHALTDGSPGPEPTAAGSPPSSVGVVLQFHGHLALLKRRQDLEENPGRWHCVTAACAPDASPVSRALESLFEETGVGASDLSDLREGSALLITTDMGTTSLIYPYLAVTRVRRLTLNAKHDSYRWATPTKLTRFDGRVPWFDDVVRSLISGTKTTPDLV